MRQAEDLVWSVITESARQRFDYTAFNLLLSGTGDERIAEFILFQLISGLAEELPLPELAESLRSDLELFGYPVSRKDLIAFLDDKPALLDAEILAARVALSGFAQGQRVPELLVQIQDLLSLGNSTSSPQIHRHRC